MLLCQYLGWFIEKINIILIAPLIKVALSFFIFSFIAASILFPTAKFDDFFVHAKIIWQQNQEEKSVPHDLENAQNNGETTRAIFT